MAFFFMYLAGNLPLMVTITFPACVSIGFGVTSKFDALSCPIVDEHDVVTTKTEAVRK